MNKIVYDNGCLRHESMSIYRWMIKSKYLKTYDITYEWNFE
jgi:hypothetical protein